MLLTLALRVPAKAFFGASAVIAVCLAVATVLQTRHWKDTAALFARGEAVAPSSPLVQFHVALDRQNRGLDREAEEHLLRALNLTDSFPAASYNLACLLMDEERFGEALPHAEKAAVGRPEWAEAHLIFANALVENGRGTDALHHYEMAAKLKPSLRIAARNAEILRRRRDAN